MKTCQLGCKTEGPPGPIWCRVCGHDPVCCTCEPLPAADSVKVPTSVDEAKMMTLVGEAWLRANAPNEIRSRPAADQELVAAAAKWNKALPLLKRVVAGHVHGHKAHLPNCPYEALEKILGDEL